MATTSAAQGGYPCPCCGHLTFAEPSGSYEICPVCFWEDDLVQFRWPDLPAVPNRTSLIEAQKTFQQVGACQERLISNVRPATPDQPIDPNWRPIDPARDSFEPSDQQQQPPWPSETTRLY